MFLREVNDKAEPVSHLGSDPKVGHGLSCVKLIGIGAASPAGRSPATPPGMRVRTGRFE